MSIKQLLMQRSKRPKIRNFTLADLQHFSDQMKCFQWVLSVKNPKGDKTHA